MRMENSKGSDDNERVESSSEGSYDMREESSEESDNNEGNNDEEL